MLDLRKTLTDIRDEDAAVATAVDQPAGVEPVHVVGTVSVRILETPGPKPEADEVEESFPLAGSTVDVPGSALRRPLVSVADVAEPLAVGTAIALVMGDARVGGACGLLVLLARWFESVLRGRWLSFGQGFVAYRADLGWPHGVQEDDDVRWNWRTGERGDAADGDER